MDNITTLRERVSSFVPAHDSTVSDFIEVQLILQEVVDSINDLEYRLAQEETRATGRWEELKAQDETLRLQFKRMQDWMTDYLEER